MIAISGGRGFLGRAICRTLELRGTPLLRIGRGDADIRWPDPRDDLGVAAVARLGGARAIVHLAGEPIGARWTAARRRAIRESRVRLTDALARAAARAQPRPSALLCASAVGIYGDRGDEWLDETSAPGSDFLATVARDWEAAAQPALEAGIRVAHLRFGVVIGAGGGMIAKVRLPFSLALGARLGDGRQWMSWIALEDAVRCVIRAIDDERIAGPMNVVSPNPVTNREFTAALARASGTVAPLVAPAFALRAAFGAMADGVLLASQRVRPARLLADGFAFEHPSLDSALRSALGR